MKKVLSIFFLLAAIFCHTSLFSASSSDELTIHLPTDDRLSPLYISNVHVDGCAFSPEYLERLIEVMQNDFCYSGYTRVLPKDSEKEITLSKENTYEVYNIQHWKNLGVAYIIKIIAHKESLDFQVFSTHTGSLKHFKDIVIEGRLSKDRRQIHKVVDSILATLFDASPFAAYRILYSLQITNKESDNIKSEIWECDWDGKNERQVTRENSCCITPILIPSHPKFNNDQFLYVSYKLSQPKIYLASLKDGIGKRLIDLRGNQLLPAISQQRDKIAFICDAGGRADLFLQTFDPVTQRVDKPVQLYSFPKATQASPTFSPDGKQIAFVSDKDGQPKIYVIPTTTSVKRSNAIQIGKQGGENTSPAWSPDGKKLAYSVKTNGIRQIWIYDFENEDEYQLTSGPGNKENPSWALDNLHLVYNTNDGNNAEMYIVNLTQSEPLKITEGPGKKHYPSWSNK